VAIKAKFYSIALASAVGPQAIGDFTSFIELITSDALEAVKTSSRALALANLRGGAGVAEEIS
jgi:hypothetical protein